MELRLLSSSVERQEFARNLVRTRISKGAGFSETQQSHIGDAHLAFGRLYALYDDNGSEPEEMLAGFVMHDLGSFPQSYPRPDLTRFRPENVFECGELWAKAAGGARLARQAGWIILGLCQAQAALVYPIFKPWNLSRAYNEGCVQVGEPIEWPYARTLEGERIFVQAMVSEGELLQNAIREAGQWGFQATPNLTQVTFVSPFGVCSKQLERGIKPKHSGVPAVDRAAV